MNKNLTKNRIITLALALLFAMAFFICTEIFKPKTTLYADNEVLIQENSSDYSDDNFIIDNSENDIYNGDPSGRTISTRVKTNKYELYKPYNTSHLVKIGCNWWLCKGEERYAHFYKAVVKFTLYEYLGQEKSAALFDFYLTTALDLSGEIPAGNSGFYWVWTTMYENKFPQSSHEFNPRVKNLINNEYGEPFSEDNGFYCLDFLFTLPLNNDGTFYGSERNYELEFSYDYYFYRSTDTYGHFHKFEHHISNENNKALKRETKSPYRIFIEKKDSENLTTNEKVYAYFGKELGTTLLGFEQHHILERIRISFLKPLVLPDGKETPFAYRATYEVDVVRTEGKILFNDVLDALVDSDDVDLERGEEKELFKCFNSNIIIYPYLHEVVDNEDADNTVNQVSYYSTYCVNFISSSGDITQEYLELKSFEEAYTPFKMSSNNTFSVLADNAYEAIFNNLINVFGLEGIEIPEGIYASNYIKPSDLYGYFGFSIVPLGGGVDAFLSKYYNSRLNSNGLCIPLSLRTYLSPLALEEIKSVYQYSFLDSFLFDVNGAINGGTNATFYAYYVAEFSNDFVYSISHNESLDIHDMRGVTDKATINGAKKVFNGIGDFLNANTDIIMIALIVVGVALVFFIIIKFLK